MWWWLRSPYANNCNNAGVVDNDGWVNNNNVNNDTGAWPALPSCQMSVPSGADPCDRAKESCSIRKREGISFPENTYRRRCGRERGRNP